MVTRWRIFSFLILLSVLWVDPALAISVQAVADRDRVAAGGSLQLELKVSGRPDVDPDFSPLQRDWDILTRSQSSQLQIINSSISRSVIYKLTLMPKKTGTVIIPAVCFGSDCTIPLPIEVASSPRSGKTDSSPLLLEADIAPQQVVAQEQLLLKIRLLRRIDLISGQLTEPQPGGVTAVVKKLGDAHSYEARRNGQIYKVIERNYAIFPQGSGTLIIPALQFDGTVADGSTRFDPLGRQGQRVRRKTQPLQVEVLPLPMDLDQRPWIPASTLRLQDDWQQQIPQFVVGEPVTRTLRLIVGGVLSAQLPILQLHLPDGFKGYPDQPYREDQLSRGGITGVLVQKIALVPTRPGHYQLPAIDLDWWDVTAGKWQSAHLDEISIDVAAATAAAVGTYPVVLPAAEQNPPVVTEESLTKSVAATNGSTSAVPPRSGFWPWLSLGLALGWLLTVLLWFRRHHFQPDREVKVRVVPPDEKAARNLVIQSAHKNEPQATRQMLLQWCRILYPELLTGVYERFLRDADPSLREQLEALDRSLYGSVSEIWSGEALAEMINNWQKEEGVNKKGELPDLYL
ncbi:MAG: protein BatD [Desulfuromusa sp.]|nr:protein BatD [Desulfuromusa sp.]